MCFSASASFITAGVVGAVGMVTVARAKEPREKPLAAIPIFFAIQQSIEGLLWLYLPMAPMDPTSSFLTYMFLLFAEVFWPIYAPITVLLVEPAPWRRILMAVCVVVGAAVAGDLLWWILSNAHTAVIRDNHIVYVTEPKHSDALGLAYLLATGIAAIMSSHRIVIATGVIFFAGSVIAYAFYWEAFVSVWCFFAAAASGIIFFHFEFERKQRLRMAST